MDLSDVLYLTYPLKVENRRGQNQDLRGMKNPSLEFSDFHHVWIWNRGFISVKKFIENCYRLKSHKFDNWYEQVFGICHTDSRALSTFTFDTFNAFDEYPYQYGKNTKNFDTYLVDVDDENKKYCKKFKSDKIFVAQLSVDHGS